MSDATTAEHAYVLDDEIQVGAIVCQTLTACGFTPRPFTAPLPFYDAIRANPPKLIVLDLALGNSDAVEVIRQLEILHYAGHVLLVSGRDEATLEEFREIGERRGLSMLPPLKKPFRVAELKRRLAMQPTAVLARQSETPAPTTVTCDLAEAIQNRWLELWYQPKISLKSLSVCGAEGLLRARHPVHGILPPRALLPAAGDPLYRPLSQFVIAQAMADFRYLLERDIRIKLAINIPASVLLAPEFIKDMRDLLPQMQDFPGLVIEVTEDEFARQANAIRETAAQLKLYDIRLSIDDFGMAYSSLARLRDVPFSELKLDRSFVANCATDSAKKTICIAAIEMAHGFGASICAEGVESADDLRTLIELRCDTAQGFLFAEPMPLEQLYRRLAATEPTLRLPGEVPEIAGRWALAS